MPKSVPLYHFKQQLAAGGGSALVGHDTGTLAAALALLAPLVSPALTGNPTAPTQTAGNNSTRIATTAFVQAAITALVNAAPGALDTLDELAAALGDDANFATTITNALALKANSADVNAALALKVGLAGDHAVTVHTGNGHGSANTKIRRFTTTMTSAGSAITYADSATDGATFTINSDGLYEIYYSDAWTTTAPCSIGISLSSNQLTTDIGLIAAASRLGIAGTGNISTANQQIPSVTRVVKLAANDVVRPHTDGGPNNTNARTHFSIRKIADA